MFPKQKEAMAVCLEKRVGLPALVLFSGPRWSGKSVTAAHVLCFHAWDTDGGNILVLTLTQSVGVDSGIWQDVIILMQQWIDAGFGMEWVKQPYLDAGTKKPAFVVSNRFGNRTKVQLDSLKNEDEVEGRYKGKRYSMIFVNEFSKFSKRKTFDTLKQALRMMHLKEEDHLFLADTNPDLVLGQASPWFELWYCFRPMSDQELEEACAKGEDSEFTVPPAALMPLRNSLRLVEFTIDDNLSVTPEKKASLMADFGHDQDVLAAYFYGRWTTASADALFFGVFRESTHVLGELLTPGNPEPEMLVPEPGCNELFAGWDLGDRHSSVSILEKLMWEEPRSGRIVPVFKLLDENVVHEDFFLDEFVAAILDKMEFWENVVGRALVWKHYSDRNVFSVKDFDGRVYLNQKVYELSDGRIPLIGAWEAQAGRGSIERRVNFVRRLLFENRLFISRTRGTAHIAMFKGLKRKRSATTAFQIQHGSIHKHPFDSMTYVCCSEAYQEMMNTMINATRRVGKGQDSVVQVQL